MLVEQSVNCLPMNPIIRVMLVEDDADTTKRLVEQFSQDGRACIVYTAGCALDAIAHCACDDFDVALVDLGLPDASGLQVIEYMSKNHPQTEALVLSMFGQAEQVVSAIRAGACGYLLKGEVQASRIVDSLVSVRLGNAAISPSIARHILRALQLPVPAIFAPNSECNTARNSEPVADIPVPSLSLRECEMLRLVSQGFVVKEIAKKLFVSPHTVTTHFKNIYRKLHVKTRGEAVFRARADGLI